jgi:hypothetical protein
VRERLFAANPKDFRARHELARTCGMLGDIEFRTGDSSAAYSMYLRSLGLTEELVQLDKASVDYQRDLGICHYRLGVLYSRGGSGAVAGRHFEECRRVREPLAPQNVRRLMELTLVVARLGEHAQAAELAERVAGEGEVDQADVRQKYQSQALAALSKAIDQGYKDVVFLQTEADLDPLREHEPFVKLLGGMKKTPSEASPPGRAGHTP